jgi:DNA invertase Pin-like site-specific DNA recombinase
MTAVTLAYCRVSTSKQTATVQNDYLNQHGYNELFTEQISGTRDDRPEFQRLVSRALELSHLGQQVTILVLDDTRWSRNVAVSLDTIERLERWGVEIKTVTGKSLSVATPEQFFQTGLDALLAAKFSRDQSQKAERSYRYRRKEKRPTGNRAPFGYRRSADGDKWEPEPKEWQLGRELVSRFIDGQTNAQIIRWLFSRGIKRSDVWIRAWLKNPTIRGHLYYRKKGRPFEKLEPIILERNAHEALISEDEYRQVLQRLDLRRRLKGKNQNARIYPVPTQIVFCACGKSAGGYSPPRGRGRKEHRYFRCKDVLCTHRKGCREDRIEAALQESLLEKAEDILKAALEPDQPIESTELITTREQLAKLRELDRAGVPGLGDSIVDIEGKIAALSVADNQSNKDIDPVLLEQFKDPKFWLLLTDEQRRSLYLDWVAQVVVKSGDVMKVDLQ